MKTGNQLIKVKCFGNYTFKISNPALFMNEIAGSTDIYKKESIIEQMRAEVTDAFQAVLNGLGTEEYHVKVGELQGKSPLIKKMMSEEVFDEPIRRRGLSIISFTIGTVTLDEESETKIARYEAMANEYLEKNRFYDVFDNQSGNGEGTNKQSTDPTDAMMKMMAMNMMQNNIQNMNGQGNGGTQQQPEHVQTNAISSNDGWTCPKCGKEASGNFCTNCGEKKPETARAKFCTNCGSKLANGTKFCPECGTKAE